MGACSRKKEGLQFVLLLKESSRRQRSPPGRCQNLLDKSLGVDQKNTPEAPSKGEPRSDLHV